MSVRSLTVALSAVLVGSLAHAQAGPRPGGGGGSRTTVTVTVTPRTVQAVNAVMGRTFDVSSTVTPVLTGYTQARGYQAGRVTAALEAVSVSFQSNMASGQQLDNAQKSAVESALKLAAMTAAVGDDAYAQRVQRFVANGLVKTILKRDDTKGEFTTAVNFLNAALVQERTMDLPALKQHIDGLVRSMLHNPANPRVQLTGLEDPAFDGSDCFGAPAT